MALGICCVCLFLKDGTVLNFDCPTSCSNAWEISPKEYPQYPPSQTPMQNALLESNAYTTLILHVPTLHGP